MNDFAALDHVLTQRLAPSTPDALLPGAVETSGFRPFFAPVLPASGRSHAHAVATEPGGKPQVEMVQVEGRIERIIVTCGCGERIEIECEY